MEEKSKVEGIRKWVGFFVILTILFLGAKTLRETVYGLFAQYAFYAFLVFVGGNAVEKIKDIVALVKK